MRLFKPFMASCLAVVGALILLRSVPVAYGKDLTGRLGVGFTNEFSNSTATRNVPAISAKYGASKDLHVLGALGFNSLSPSSFTLAGKIFKNIFYETNLNFYSAVGLAYLKDVQSGVEILGVLGCEFFIPGVDSLGMLFETGVSASNVTGTFAIKTIGFTFIHAGMHFYF